MTKEECEIETSKAIMEMRNRIAELEKENAELKELKTRRMTHKELAHWLREKPKREWKYKNGVTVYGYYGYEEKCENEEVLNNILIREDDSEWREPLVIYAKLF